MTGRSALKSQPPATAVTGSSLVRCYFAMGILVENESG